MLKWDYSWITEVKKPMKISFVIPAYNEEHYIADCLDSVFAQSKNAPCGVEIIVVDNGSTDKTADIVARYPGAHLVHEPQKGHCSGTASGTFAATGDLIANIDADTRLTPKWIQKIVEEFEKDDALVGLSGPFHLLRSFAEDKIWSILLLPRIRLVSRKPLPDPQGSVVQGGNFVIRRKAFKSVAAMTSRLIFTGKILMSHGGS